jgi:hypothetical protein
MIVCGTTGATSEADIHRRWETIARDKLVLYAVITIVEVERQVSAAASRLDSEHHAVPGCILEVGHWWVVPASRSVLPNQSAVVEHHDTVVARVGILVKAEGDTTRDTVLPIAATQGVRAEVDTHAVGTAAVTDIHFEGDGYSVVGCIINLLVALAILHLASRGDSEDASAHLTRA